MISFDFKSGYHHIDIHSASQTFLGFCWKGPQDRLCRYFVFTVLPFGLASAPYIFTKCLKPLEKYWRIQGVKIALFLDDGWIIEHVLHECKQVAREIRSDLNKAGFITNDEKSVWQPCQSITWLGLIWNTSTVTICITEQRHASITNTIENIFRKKFYVSARETASLVGKIISAGTVFGKISRIMTRYCSIAVAAAQDWDSKFVLDDYSTRELTFWRENIQRINVKKIDSLPVTSNYVIYSDANATGCGAHFDLNGEQICHKQWTMLEQGKSSTWRELSAIEFALESFLSMLKGSYIKWFSDSQTACRIVQVGSMRKDLHIIAIRIFQLCVDHHIELDIQWIPRTEIEKADYISRMIDIDDWQITQSCSNYLDSVWGKHTVDCFANYYNKKISRFFSWHWNPDCAGVDFFVQNL